MRRIDMTRNGFLLGFLNFCLLSCSSLPNKDGEQVIIEQQSYSPAKVIETNVPDVKFKEFKGQAILIGDSIKLLDNHLEKMEDISNYSTKRVDITGISDTLFNVTNDICDAYWFVKVKVDNKEGVVNGRQVFKIQKSNQDTTVFVNGQKLEFLTTQCLAMGIEYQGDLMDCPVAQPVVLRDERNDFNGLISVIRNDYYKEAIYNQDFRYFQLRNDGGYFDEIVGISSQESGIKLLIHRWFQEGENDYSVLLRYEQGKYTAEYLSFGEIRYE